MNLNKLMIIGNLGHTPELRQTPGGQKVTTFPVATNHAYTNAAGNRIESVEFHQVVCWSKLAEICAQYLHKGDKVYVEGRVQSREWTGKDGTQKRDKELIAENVIFLNTKPRADAPPSDQGVTPASYGDSGGFTPDEFPA